VPGTETVKFMPLEAEAILYPFQSSSRSTIHMTGYLMFLKNLSEYQQRAEIGRLAFSERWSGSSLEEDILKDQAVVTFSETLGINPRLWKFQLRHMQRSPRSLGLLYFAPTNA
jgi:hypothetical protein